LRSFLKNSIAFQDRKWKLVNRVMINSNIYLTREEAGRLLQEETQKQIQERLSQATRLELPRILEQRTNRLKELLDRRRKTEKSYELPTEIVIGAFPSCIKVLHDNASSGRHLSHMGRFALASFLLNVGLSAEKIIELFTEASDFDERMTRYQVEHIAGIRGTGTKYSSPNCSTLKTHGLCRSPDEICKSVRHPLSYYRRKLDMTRRVSEQ